MSSTKVLAWEGKNLDQAISSLCFDSRKATKGSAFFAMPGTLVDGHDYIEKAISLGAVAIVCEKMPEQLAPNVAYAQVENAAKEMGKAASIFFEHPTQKIKLVAVTGTNGKTTSVTLLHRLFRKLGYHVGLISTVENKIDEEVLDTKYTTPDSVTLNQLLGEMVAKGCTHCFMEASSHAIWQERTAGLQFAGAVFSNISHDHLDYHKTFKNYIDAKKKLFDELPKTAFALSNIDDKRGSYVLQNCKAKKLTYALRSMADFKARLLENTFDGLQLELDGQQIWFRLTGGFNAYNLLASYAVAVSLGENKEKVLTALSDVQPARGRFEQLVSENNIRAIVDYAHTPDALENVLETIAEINQGKSTVITVVGCGGNRDKEKRPKMAAIAARLSNRVILTSDNPRNEEPEQIIREMEAGISEEKQASTLSITDRKQAITKAVELAQTEDVVLVAGKGHETYQEIKGERFPFDDKEIITELFKTKTSNS
ncbi:UDP-N-acetylmuramoyl-L-alanyl-D-glutamate--2,6-diaminopimelate ligase [Flammeovirgaceae bacterium SG7u.111]|nr:UDP-N-acetylmuramoyl-L-alanyl-D-glutamate--2,6-diaminopimelate ligase [Flammeovirgaceae bacterium SG7u.132]WPO33806.1 UDP-N-acetylmuramoyl-L-alanyl-D-glutamate--2,6-diaminopimelate ligase [Flammeovirgaceae bacterium SG7u.111]